ncbi:hypothetical protein MMC32_004007 [Xylographa parallela]|nr:hypothetical protein [Xylographa parallela]
MPLSQFDKFLDDTLRTEDFVKILSVKTVDRDSTEYRIDNQNLRFLLPILMNIPIDAKATHHNLQMQVNKGAMTRHVSTLKRAGGMDKSRPTVATVLVHRQLPHDTKNLGESIRYAFHETSALGQNKESVKIIMDEHGTISPKTIAEYEASKAVMVESKNNKGKGVDKGAAGKRSGRKA